MNPDVRNGCWYLSFSRSLLKRTLGIGFSVTIEILLSNFLAFDKIAL